MEDGSCGNYSTTDASSETGIEFVNFENEDPEIPLNWPIRKQVPVVIVVFLMNALKWVC